MTLLAAVVLAVAGLTSTAPTAAFRAIPPEPGIVDVALTPPPLEPVPPPPDPPPPWWMTDSACDPVWCRYRFIAYQAADRGDMVTVIWAAAISYGVVQWAPWMVATMRCESGLNPHANSGWYRGLAQHDPALWPARAAAAGLAGADINDPVNNAMVTAWMIAAGYSPTQHWPTCGRNGLQP